MPLEAVDLVVTIAPAEPSFTINDHVEHPVEAFEKAALRMFGVRLTEENLHVLRCYCDEILPTSSIVEITRCMLQAKYPRGRVEVVENETSKFRYAAIIRFYDRDYVFSLGDEWMSSLCYETPQQSVKALQVMLDETGGFTQDFSTEEQRAENYFIKNAGNEEFKAWADEMRRKHRLDQIDAGVLLKSSIIWSREIHATSLSIDDVFPSTGESLD